MRQLFTGALGGAAAGAVAVGLLSGTSAHINTKSATTVAYVRTTVPSSTDTPVHAVAPTKLDATTFGPVTINCGYVTCSAYLSRSVTRDAYQKSIVLGGGYAAAATVICAPLAVPPLTPLGVACAAAAAVQGPLIAQEISDAATQHGVRGACLKVTYTKPVGDIPPVITWWSTNNGKYCKD